MDGSLSIRVAQECPTCLRALPQKRSIWRPRSSNQPAVLGQLRVDLLPRKVLAAFLGDSAFFLKVAEDAVEAVRFDLHRLGDVGGRDTGALGTSLRPARPSRLCDDAVARWALRPEPRGLPGPRRGRSVPLAPSPQYALQAPSLVSISARRRLTRSRARSNAPVAVDIVFLSSWERRVQSYASRDMFAVTDRPCAIKHHPLIEGGQIVPAICRSRYASPQCHSGMGLKELANGGVTSVPYLWPNSQINCLPATAERTKYPGTQMRWT